MQVNGIRHVPARGRYRIPRPDRVWSPDENGGWDPAGDHRVFANRSGSPLAVILVIGIVRAARPGRLNAGLSSAASRERCDG
jgi:hypothetical protein